MAGAAAVALGTAVAVLAGRHLLMGETAEGVVLALADAGLVGLWLRRLRWTPRSTALGLALAFLAWSASFIALGSTIGPDGRRYFCLFDDAMISMRYAWNLAHGQGLVWNPGERVEGYTNLFMTLVMAVPLRLLDQRAAVLVVQLLGVASMLAAALLAGAIGGRVARPRDLAPEAAGSAAVRVGPFAAVLLCYPLAYWSLMGMETGLLAVLLLGAVFLALAPSHGERPSYLLSALLGLAVMTRPDAMAQALVVFTWTFFNRPAGRPALRSWLTEAAAFALFPAGITLFRWLYYGSLVPNTYVLKIEGLPLSFRLQSGLVSLAPYVACLLPVIGLAALALREDSRRRSLLVALWASSLAYHVWSGGDAWPRWRYLCPTLPLLLVLAAHGARRLAESDVRWPRWLAFPALAAVLVLVNGPFLREAFLARYPFGMTENHVNVHIAVQLKRVLTPQATVGVFFAGTVPYYSGLRAVDFLGKSDLHVARRPPDLRLPVGHNKTDLRYSIGERKPDYVEDFYWGEDAVPSAQQEQYVRVADLWLRRGSPHVLWEAVEAGW